MKRVFLSLGLLLFSIPDVFAWGQEGHSIIAEIAQRRLSKEATDAISAIINTSQGLPGFSVTSLGSMASWADDVRYPGTEHPESYNWHFVDIPLGPLGTDYTYDPNRDCKSDPKGDCVVAELKRLKDELRCATDQKQFEALKFAVHLVGDAHQPFHTVLEAQGENLASVHILFGGKICDKITCFIRDEWQNLHYVWDITIITKTFYSWGSYVDDLESGWLTTVAARNDSKDDPIDWVNDSHTLAKKFVVNDGASLFNGYYNDAHKVVDQQLGLAGLRLARYLNNVFSSKQCPVQ
jgi:S1/P1 Nuclease